MPSIMNSQKTMDYFGLVSMVHVCTLPKISIGNEKGLYCPVIPGLLRSIMNELVKMGLYTHQKGIAYIPPAEDFSLQLDQSS